MKHKDMHPDEVRQAVSTCIQQLLAEQDIEEEITANTPLFSSGLLDSMSMLRLVSMLERSMGIAVSPGEITIETFDNLDRICAAVLNSR